MTDPPKPFVLSRHNAGVSPPPVPRPASSKPPAPEKPSATVEGQILKTPTWGPIRALLIATGLLFVRHLLVLMGRYLLALKGTAGVSLQANLVTLTTEWSLLGRPIRRSVTTSPVSKVTAIRFENRQRYLYLLIGIGCLATGTLLGAQWFLNGLRAGYPYLMLLGALLVIAGVAVDVVLYLFYPFRKSGASILIITLAPWTIRIKGVETAAAEHLIEAVHRSWQS